MSLSSNTTWIVRHHLMMDSLLCFPLSVTSSKCRAMSQILSSTALNSHGRKILTTKYLTYNYKATYYMQIAKQWRPNVEVYLMLHILPEYLPIPVSQR